MRNYHGASLVCATCQWWDGTREADRRAGRVHTIRDAAMGHCRSPVSWWVGRARQGESECRFWQQWKAVRAATGRQRSSLVKLGPFMPHAPDPASPPE